MGFLVEGARRCLTNAALRRPGFSDGPKVVLGDGQAWAFPRPWLRLYPVASRRRPASRVGGRPGYGRRFDDLVDRAGRLRSRRPRRPAGPPVPDGRLLLLPQLRPDRPRPPPAPGRRPGRPRLRGPLGPDQPGPAGPLPKTFSRWLRHTLIANGVTQDLPWEDAIGVAHMLVALGRAVPPSRWLESLSARSEEAAREALF